MIPAVRRDNDVIMTSSESHERGRWQTTHSAASGADVVMRPVAGWAGRSACDRCQAGVTVYHAVQTETSERQRCRRLTAGSGTGRRDGQRQRAWTTDGCPTTTMIFYEPRRTSSRDAERPWLDHTRRCAQAINKSTSSIISWQTATAYKM